MAQVIDVYQDGTRVRVFGQFKDFNGTPTLPTSVSITVKKPDGTTVSPSVITDVHPKTGDPGVGYAYADVLADQGGRYFARIVGTGGIDAADEGSFQVRSTDL